MKRFLALPFVVLLSMFSMMTTRLVLHTENTWDPREKDYSVVMVSHDDELYFWWTKQGADGTTMLCLDRFHELPLCYRTEYPDCKIQAASRVDDRILLITSCEIIPDEDALLVVNLNKQFGVEEVNLIDGFKEKFDIVKVNLSEIQSMIMVKTKSQLQFLGVGGEVNSLDYTLTRAGDSLDVSQLVLDPDTRNYTILATDHSSESPVVAIIHMNKLGKVREARSWSVSEGCRDPHTLLTNESSLKVVISCLKEGFSYLTTFTIDKENFTITEVGQQPWHIRTHVHGVFLPKKSSPQVVWSGKSEQNEDVFLAVSKFNQTTGEFKETWISETQFMVLDQETKGKTEILFLAENSEESHSLVSVSLTESKEQDAGFEKLTLKAKDPKGDHKHPGELDLPDTLGSLEENYLTKKDGSLKISVGPRVVPDFDPVETIPGSSSTPTLFFVPVLIAFGIIFISAALYYFYSKRARRFRQAYEMAQL
mmetsp:Transcript_6870/g.7605  ORF Transcript_6870/g.7605 Transcript_6870/m.7605 type:complete len:480 (+) Transcript_6870:28-1467(+)